MKENPSENQRQRFPIYEYMKPQKLIKWTPEGMPIPYTKWVLPKSRIDDVFMASLSLPYEGEYDLETGEALPIPPRFQGLTNIEVAAIKAAERASRGDIETLKFLVERLQGKPKQQVENTNVNISLTDLLKSIDIPQTVDVNSVPQPTPTSLNPEDTSWMNDL